MEETIYKPSGHAVGYHNGTHIYALTGHGVGILDGTHVYTLQGGYVGELEDGMILYKSTSLPNIGGRSIGSSSARNPGSRGGISTSYKDVSDKIFGKAK